MAQRYFHLLKVHIEIHVYKSKFNSREIESINLFYLGVLPLYIDVPSPLIVTMDLSGSRQQ